MSIQRRMRGKNACCEALDSVLFSTLAAVLERPDSHIDHKALIAAGLRGALAAYQAIVTKESRARQSSLDYLLEQRRRGELDAHLSTQSFANNPDNCAEQTRSR